jgi:hypothetical protein
VAFSGVWEGLVGLVAFWQIGGSWGGSCAADSGLRVTCLCNRLEVPVARTVYPPRFTLVVADIEGMVVVWLRKPAAWIGALGCSDGADAQEDAEHLMELVLAIRTV